MLYIEFIRNLIDTNLVLFVIIDNVITVIYIYYCCFKVTSSQQIELKFFLKINKKDTIKNKQKSEK